MEYTSKGSDGGDDYNHRSQGKLVVEVVLDLAKSTNREEGLESLPVLQKTIPVQTPLPSVCFGQ